jgi:hypothetical protein
MLTEFDWLSIDGTTVPVRAMLSVRDTAIATQKVSHEFEECSCSVPLVLTNSAAAQCHWSYRILCCSYITKWRTSDPDRPAGWWRHWPEILRRMSTVKTTGILRLCCIFSNCMEYSAACDVLVFQVPYKLRIRLGHCHVQNVCHW